MQERALKTREMILQAAAEAFDKFGFDGTSIREIMQRAGVTPGALYFHFPSKKDLAQAVMTGQGRGLELPPGDDGLQRLINISLYLAGELQTNAALRAGVRLAVDQGEFGLQDVSPYLRWVQVFADQLHAARAKGELLPDIAVEDLAWTLVSSYTGTQLLSQLSCGRADLPQRMVALWRFLLPGITANSVQLPAPPLSPAREQTAA